MTKKLNEAAVLSELREGSAFFRDAEKSTTPSPKEGAPQLTKEPQVSREKPKRTFERTNEPTNVRTNVGQQKREKIRHTFDIYADQLLALQTLQLEAVRAGKRKPKLGDMVQKALDAFLKKQKRNTKTFDRSNERTIEQI